MKNQNIKPNKEPELCPYMSLWPLWGSIVVYCSFNSDDYRLDYDRCAIHDDWTKRDECPLHFTYDKVAERVKVLAEKKGLDVRSVFGINFKSPGKPVGIFKKYCNNLIYHTEPFRENPKMCMDVMVVKITNLDKFLKQGYCWFDHNGKIENSEPLKVGDVGYVNLIDPKGKGQSTVVLEFFAEDVGVELLDTKLLTASTYEMEKLLKE